MTRVAPHWPLSTTHSRRALGAALALTLLAPDAQADIFAGKSGAATYWAYLLGMPDLDQLRAAGEDAYGNDVSSLPGNGGMYCGPTSMANVLTYLANDGFPEVDPGPVSFEPEDSSAPGAIGRNYRRYENATEFIAELGADMGTSTSTGTGDSAMKAELEWRLPDFEISLVGERDCDGTSASASAASPTTLYKNFAAGSLMIVHLAYYVRETATGRWTRSSGHFVAATGITASPSAGYRFYFRDSARNRGHGDADLHSQDVFAADASSLSSVTLKSSDSKACTRTRFAVDTRSSDTKKTVIETLLVISPP